MESDVIRVLHRCFHGVGFVDGGAQLPGVLHGNIGVITYYVHAHATGGGVGHQRADSAQTDNSQFLAAQFGADKLALFLFHQLFQALGVLIFLDAGNAARDVAGGEQQARDDQLGHGVGVGTGGVENNDALLRALLNRNVVDAGARAGDGQQGIRQDHIVNGRAAHQDGVGGGFLGGHRVLAGGQNFMDNGRNVVQSLNFIHRSLLLSRLLQMLSAFPPAP